MAECQAALAIGDVYDDDSYWSWAMHVDQQGAVQTAAETEALAEQFLQRKAAQ